MSIFIDFRLDLGSFSGLTLNTILRVSVILGGKMGDSFQVHVVGDSGREMMPECNVCMSHNHSKNKISLFSLSQRFGVLRDGFRSHFGVFW